MLGEQNNPAGFKQGTGEVSVGIGAAATRGSMKPAITPCAGSATQQAKLNKIK